MTTLRPFFLVFGLGTGSRDGMNCVNTTINFVFLSARFFFLLQILPNFD